MLSQNFTFSKNHQLTHDTSVKYKDKKLFNYWLIWFLFTNFVCQIVFRETSFLYCVMERRGLGGFPQPGKKEGVWEYDYRLGILPLSFDTIIFFLKQIWILIFSKIFMKLHSFFKIFNEYPFKWYKLIASEVVLM